MEPRWQGKPRHPIRDALQQILGKPPPGYVKGYDYSNLTDEEHQLLQEWAVNCLDGTLLFWSTGIGSIEAAQKLVEEAVSNGNIPGKDSEWRRRGLPADFFEPKVKTPRKKKKKRQVR
jgi:hypothetical protein